MRPPIGQILENDGVEDVVPAVLVEAGLLSIERVGRTSIHHLHAAPLDELRDWLDRKGRG